MKNTNKKYEFANPTIGANTYAGQLALPYVSSAVKANSTVLNGGIRTIDGFNSKAVITSLTVADPLGAGNCDFNPTDSTIGESVITLTEFNVNLQYCRKTIYPTWIGQGMDRNGNLPQSFEAFMLETVVANVGQAIEDEMWQGGGNWGTGFLSNDGSWGSVTFGNSAMKDFTTQELTNAPSTANILDNLNEVYAKVVASKSALLSKEGFGFYMSQQMYSYYAMKLGSTTTFQQLGSAGAFTGLTYMGFPIYVCNGMFNDVIVATYPENLVLASNSLSDMNELRLIPAYEYDGSDNIKVAMRFSAGVGCSVPADGVIVYNFV